MFNPMNEILTRVDHFSNAHSHLDRAYTLTEEDFYNSNINKHLFEKWKLVEKIKETSSEFDYYLRIMRACEYQWHYNVRNILSFIDIDTIVKTKAIKAAARVKREVKQVYNMNLIIANQSILGLEDQENRNLIESNMDFIDVLGGIPKVENFDSHLDLLFNWSKDTGKRIHVHVDQLNDPSERETEMLARKTIKYGLEGKVTAVHAISLAAHKKDYRKEVYRIAKDAGMSFITCPTAWIDHRRNETLSVTHNAITPVEELLENDLLVGIGTDNIADIYKPFSTGDIVTEIKFLIECLHFYDIGNIVKILTDNNNKIIGL